MNRLREALTRKYGPLPAWGWLLIFGLGVWYYRKRYGGATATVTSTTTPADTSSTTSADPIVLQPGESAYNPATGGLVTAPGDASGTGSTDPGSTGQPLPSVNLGPINIKLPTMRQPKPRAGSTQHGKPVGDGKPRKTRPRSGTIIKRKTHGGPNPGGLASPQNKPPKKARGTVTGSVGHVIRQRPLTPALRPAMVQRPMASATPKNRPTMVANPPRPSAPPPRKANRTINVKRRK